MKINKKEKMLLSILLFIIVGVSYYNFIYIKQVQKVEELDIKKIELENKYNEVVQTIEQLEEKQEKISSLKVNVNKNSKDFYPSIIQEKIIIELDEYIKASRLEGNISFDEVIVEAIEKDDIAQKENNTTTFEKYVEEYNSKNVEVSNEENELDTTEQVNNNQSEENQPTAEHIKATITFKGAYNAVTSFISKIEGSGRNTVITDLATTSGLNGEITGNLNLEFYAIPKIDEKDNEYLEWTIVNSYGKAMPFIVEKPVEVTPDSVAYIQKQNSNGDFSIIVKSDASDLPSVLISKVGDSTNETAISAENKNIEDINIEINKVGDKYYYKYKTSKNNYPKDYSGNGVEFVPSQDKIIIDILSESRINVDDKSGVNINIINNTDKVVETIITNDDNTNPRVKVIGQEGKTIMTKK